MANALSNDILAMAAVCPSTHRLALDMCRQPDRPALVLGAQVLNKLFGLDGRQRLQVSCERMMQTDVNPTRARRTPDRSIGIRLNFVL